MAGWLFRRPTGKQRQRTPFAFNDSQHGEPFLPDGNGSLDAASSVDAPMVPSQLPAQLFIRSGVDISEDIKQDPRLVVVEAYPDHFLSVLKHLAVIKLGTCKASDSEVLAAFGSNDMLTRGCDALIDPGWEDNWLGFIKQKAHGNLNVDVGWEEMVTLGAYAVSIKNITCSRDGALLELLLQKYSSGAASKKIWEFPAVRAVINYHWQHWAGSFLLAQATIFSGWVITFAVYLGLYNETDTFDDGIGWNGNTHGIAYALNFLSFCFMIPFALLEIWSTVQLQTDWLQPHNLLDTLNIVLQLINFTCHIRDWEIGTEWFSVLLGFQCVFLFLRLQNFGRVLGTGASISEIFVSVMYDARFLIGYIFLTGVSASLCLGAIYKHDTEFQESGDGDAFNSTLNSLVTTFHVMFGGFEPKYVFQASSHWVKCIFFFGIDVLMAITVLNLLIAIMTESYSTFVAEQRIRYDRGRADVIREFESIGVPTFYGPEQKPFVHFLVVEKKASKKETPTPAVSRTPSMVRRDADDDLHKRVDDLSQKVERVLQMLEQTPKGPGSDLE